MDRRVYRSLWLQLVLVLLLSAAALTPHLRGDVPYTDDGGNYRWRMVELTRLMRHGLLFARWQPDMVFGYGYPVFGFNFPLSVYPGALLYLLGLDVQWSWNLTLALYTLGCGLTAFLLARELFSGWSVWVAVVGYVYAPYLFTDTLYRGNPGEALSLALFPLILWAIYRVATRRRWGDVVVTAISSVALLLAHSAATLFFSPFAMAWAVLIWLTTGRSRRAAGRLAMAVLLALGLGAFYLIPGLAEQDTIQIKRVVTGDLDFHHHFLYLDELAQWPGPADPHLVNYLPPRSQGIGQAILGLLALLTLPWLAGRNRWMAAFFGSALLLVNLFLLPASATVWERVPLMRYIIYPWRMVGLAGLWGALAAACVFTLLQGRMLRAAAIGVQAFFVINALPWLYPNHIPYPGNYALAHIMRFEAGTGVLGGTAIGEYLPVWVERLPDAEVMIAQYEAGGPIRRLLAQDLPPGVTIEQERYGLLDADLTLTAAAPATLTYRTFYFPGWNVTIDGQRVPTAPSQPEGLLQFPLPAGQHEVRVTFGTTAPRTAGGLISAAAALACVGLLWRDRYDAGKKVVKTKDSPGSPRTMLWAEAGLAIVLITAKLALFDRYPTWVQATQMTETGLVGANWQPNINFDGQLFLRSASIPAQVTSGELLPIHLYAQTPGAVSADYRLSARLVDAQGLLWSEKEPVRPSGTRYRSPPPTFEWQPGDYADLWLSVPLLAGTPPGDYWLRVGAFAYPSLAELAVVGADGSKSRTTVDLGPIHVTPPSQPPERSTLQVQAPQATELTSGLTLWGTNLDRTVAQPGDPLLTTLFWKVTGAQSGDWLARIELVGAEGLWTLGDALPLGNASYPPTRWEPDAVLRDQHLLRLPAEVTSGEYELQMTLLNADSTPHTAPVRLGSLRIEAPEMMTAPPPELQHPLAIHLGQGEILLCGYDLDLSAAQPGGALHLTLYWQATATITTNYKVFVHLLDAGGVVWGQADAIPVGWSRPTTGWRQGEVIVDHYQVPIAADAPPGDYRLAIGMYQEGGPRLPLFDTSGPLGDALMLPGIRLRP